MKIVPLALRSAHIHTRIYRSAALEFLSSLTIEFLFCLTLSTEGVTASHGACDECHTPASSASMQPMFIEEGTTGFTIINNLGRILVRL
jgi:hypothetical protein